jgi:hypothetical protein
MNRKQILGIALLSAISLVGCQKKDPSLMAATEISSNWTFHQADKDEGFRQQFRVVCTPTYWQTAK